MNLKGDELIRQVMDFTMLLKKLGLNEDLGNKFYVDINNGVLVSAELVRGG